MRHVFRVLVVLVIISLSPVMGLSQKAPKEDAKYYNSLGLENIKKDQFDQAINNLNKAIKLKKDFASAYNNRGYAYYNKRNFDKAISDYDQAIKFRI